MRSRRIEDLNLHRARTALCCVRAAKKAGLGGDYLRAVEAFPFNIRSLGLGQALALLCAGGAKDRGKLQLYRDLQSWLCEQQQHSPYYNEDKAEEQDLLGALSGGTQADYRTALIETEAWLAWLKPVAQALLSDAGTEAAA